MTQKTNLHTFSLRSNFPKYNEHNCQTRIFALTAGLTAGPSKITYGSKKKHTLY